MFAPGVVALEGRKFLPCGFLLSLSRTVGHDPLPLNLKHGGNHFRNVNLNNECWSHHSPIRRFASDRRDAQNESDGAGAAQLRRSSSSVAALSSRFVAAAAPSQQHSGIRVQRSTRHFRCSPRR